MTQTFCSTPVDLAKTLAAGFSERAAQADKIGVLPQADIAALTEAQYLLINVPKTLGGWGHSMQTTIASHMELAKGSGSTALVAGMTVHTFGHAIGNKTWSPELTERFVAALKSGAVFNSVASEPQLGSPSRGGLPKTFAEQVEGGWRINGHKNWTTGGTHLTHMLVKLRVEEQPAMLLIENNRDGIRWETTWRDALSLRASDSHDVYFEDVVVPTHNLVELGKIKKPPNMWFPMIVAAVYLGVGLAARDATIKYALERVPTALGKPIATLPKIQRQIGEIDVALEAAKSLLLSVAGEWDVAENKVALMSRIIMAKHLATETAIDVTDKALRIAGGASISNDLPLERYFRDVRAGLMHPPSGDAAFEMVGRAAIGL